MVSGGKKTRSHECERCTHECVRHEIVMVGTRNRDQRAWVGRGGIMRRETNTDNSGSRLKAGCSQDWPPHKGIM
jgi:hypothetical protein